MYLILYTNDIMTVQYLHKNLTLDIIFYLFLASIPNVIYVPT